MNDIDQRSPEWYQSRVGRIGCSRLGDVLAQGKGGAPSSTRRNYMMQLLTERLTGKYEEGYQSPDMLRGIQLEPIARSEYEARTGHMVLLDGGKEHSTIKGWGCSPDGLIFGENGGIEIKCPNQSTHLDTVLNGTVKRDYLYQMTGGVVIYEKDFWDFVSFNPDFPDNLCFYTKRFYRDDLPIDDVRDGVIKFLDELNELEAKVRALK